MKQYLSALILAVGISLSGLFIYLGINQLSNMNRTVSVKGLATRTVESDHVVWPLSFTITGNDLPELYERTQQLGETVRQHLIKHGFESEDVRLGTTNVSDQWDNYYGQNRPADHYSMTTQIIVSTAKVKLVAESKLVPAELLKRGIILDSNDWGINYSFNGLSELKPSMIEEATRNARAVAQKFAEDSESKLGGIRSAYQGQFSIEDDEYEPWMKHVRVVTTVDYNLE